MNKFFQKKTAVIFHFNSAVANDRKNKIFEQIREYLVVEHQRKYPKKRVVSKTAFFMRSPECRNKRIPSTAVYTY